MKSTIHLSFVVFVTLVLSSVKNVEAELGAYTSYVNLEKLYTLEDELVTLSDVILKQERNLHGEADIHGIYNISTTIETVKEIHRQVVATRNLTSYLVHPINIYHMVKRLSRDWHTVIATLEESKTCSKSMKYKIDNMSDNVPKRKHLKLVIASILRLQNVYNISVTDVISGTIGNITAFASLSLDDAFDFARVAYETDHYSLAVDWLKYVTSEYDGSTASFNITNAMHLLSSSFLKMKKPKEAIAVLDELLKHDPSNKIAHSNIKFITTKVETGVDEGKVDEMAKKGTHESVLQSYCSGGNQAQSKRQRPMFCVFTSQRRGQDLYTRPSVKTEVLSIKPLIVLYKDMTNSSEQKALQHLGYAKMKEMMFKSNYMYPNGIDGMNIQDRTYWKWVERLKQTLEDIDNTHSSPQRSQFMVKNVGLEGYKNKAMSRYDNYIAGTYVVFLSGPAQRGGDVVFPRQNVRVTPEKGSVLFFERTAAKHMNICPVIADTEWVGMYQLHTNMATAMCYPDTIIRPLQQ